MFVSSIAFCVIIIRYLFTFCWVLFLNFVKAILAPSEMVYWFSNLITTRSMNTVSFSSYPGVGLVNLKPCVGRFSNNRPKGQKACPLTRERIKRESSTPTTSMERSPSLEVNSCSGTQEIPCNLCKPDVHCRIQKSLRLIPIMNYMNPIHIRQSIYLTSMLMPHLRLGLQNGFLP
jgi:hypothetical protein